VPGQEVVVMSWVDSVVEVRSWVTAATIVSATAMTETRSVTKIIWERILSLSIEDEFSKE